jgi:hypothetical protein
LENIYQVRGLSVEILAIKLVPLGITVKDKASARISLLGNSSLKIIFFQRNLGEPYFFEN